MKNFNRNKAIFLDRDGVLNRLIAPNYDRGPRKKSELNINYELKSTLFYLSQNKFFIDVVSNQPDVARGLLTLADHQEIVSEIQHTFPEINNQRYCFHNNNDDCFCRKPKTGLLEQAKLEYNLNPKDCFFIGDKWTDILTAKNFGCKSILLKNSSSWLPTSQGSPPQDLLPDFVVTSVSEVIKILN